MTKHATETHTLGEIINMTDARTDGWPVLDALGINYDGDHWPTRDSDLQRQVEVSWPEHVINPKFDGDATYCFVD